MKYKQGQDTAIVFSVGAIAFFIALVVVFMGFDYVPAGHTGVTDRLGVVGETPWGPGIKWTGLLTGTERFTTRIQINEYDANSASSDLQVVNTKITLNFKINPIFAPEIYRSIGPDYQNVIISPVIQEAVKSSTAKYKAEDLIKERTKVKNDITNYIMSKLESRGLIVTEVSITDFNFSPEFNAAIEQKQVAEQQALTAENRFNEMEWTSKSMKLQSEVLEIKRLDLQQQWINKWDGKLPTFMSGDGNGLLMNMDLNSIVGAN